MPDALIDDLEVRRRAWGLAFALLGNAADAEDAVQDALIVAFDKAQSIPRSDRGRWFVGVVRNVARNHIRKRRQRAMNDLTEYHATSQRERLDPADAESLIAALQEVSDDEREAIVLCHMQGLSLDEVSKLLDVNRNTLKSRIQRGLAYLRDRLRVTLPGLEAYLATVAIPPPQGGFDAALSRWTNVARPKVPWLSARVQLVSLSAAAALAVVVLWLALVLKQDPEASTRVASSSAGQPGTQAADRTAPRTPAADDNETPGKSPEPGSRMGDSKTAPAPAPGKGDVNPSNPERSGNRPPDIVTPGAYRTRYKFYENGALEAEWKELQRAPGVYTLDGNFVGFYPTGVLREIGQFANNMRVGFWRSFHDNAAPESLGEYVNDRQEGMWELHNKVGILLEKGPYTADKRTGEWRIYYSDTGALREEVTFKDDVRHGQGIRYDQQGNKAAETSWERGKRHGIERVYGPNGVEEHEYKHGERVK